jgi:hypothetical protein
MGFCIFSFCGLRVSRFLNLRRVSGSKSDTPTKANNCQGSYSNEQEKTRKTEVGASGPKMLDTGSWPLDPRSWILYPECWKQRGGKALEEWSLAPMK